MPWKNGAASVSHATGSPQPSSSAHSATIRSARWRCARFPGDVTEPRAVAKVTSASAVRPARPAATASAYRSSASAIPTSLPSALTSARASSPATPNAVRSRAHMCQYGRT
jgi:hypothetical protein